MLQSVGFAVLKIAMCMSVKELVIGNELKSRGREKWFIKASMRKWFLSWILKLLGLNLVKMGRKNILGWGNYTGTSKHIRHIEGWVRVIIWVIANRQGKGVGHNRKLEMMWAEDRWWKFLSGALQQLEFYPAKNGEMFKQKDTVIP